MGRTRSKFFVQTGQRRLFQIKNLLRWRKEIPPEEFYTPFSAGSNKFEMLNRSDKVIDYNIICEDSGRPEKYRFVECHNVCPVSSDFILNTFSNCIFEN